MTFVCACIGLLSAIDSAVRCAVVGRLVPWWGPVVIEGYLWFELLLELNSPMAILEGVGNV